MQLYSLIPLILSISGLPSTGATSRRYDDVARVDLGRLPDGTVTLHVIGYGQGKYYSPYSPPEAHNPHKQKSAWKKLKHGFKKHVTNPLRRLVGLESNKQKLKRTNKMLAEVQKMAFGRRFCSKLDDINKVLRSVDPLATGVAYPECKSKYQMHSTVVVYPINARATAFGVNYGAGSGATSTKIKYKSSSGSTTTKIKQKGSGTGGAHPQTHEPIGQQVQRMVQNMFGKLMSNFQRSHVQPCHSTTTAASPMGGTGAMPVGCNGAPTPMTCTHQPMVSQPTYQHKGRYTLSHHAPQYASPATCGGQKIKIKYTRPATHGTGMPCQQAHPHYKASYKTKMSTPAYQHTTQGTGMSCHQAQPHYKTSYKVKSHGASHQHAGMSCHQAQPQAPSHYKTSYKVKASGSSHQHAGMSCHQAQPHYKTSYKVKTSGTSHQHTGMGCHQAQPHYKTSYKVKTSGTSHQHAGMSCHQAQPHYKTSYKVKTSGAPHQRTGMGCHQAQPHYKTSYKVKTGSSHQHTGMGCHQAQPHYKTSYKVKTGSSHGCHQQISAPSSASYKLKIKSPAYAQQPSAGHHSGHFHQHQHLPCQQITQTHPMSAQLMGSLRAPGGPHYCTPHQIQHASHCHWAHIKHGYSGSHNKNHGRHGKHHQGHATVKLYKNASGKGGTYCVQVVHRHKSAGGPALI